MWQRFTEKARRVVFYAQEEAERLGGRFVSTEQLLAGLLRDSDTIAVHVLVALGVPFDRVEAGARAALASVPIGSAQPGQDMTLTDQGKRAIDYAYAEARLLGDKHIGTEHLLLGLVRGHGTVAGNVLASLGVEIGTARTATREVRSRYKEGAVKQKTARLQQPSFDPQTFWDTVTLSAKRVVHFAATDAMAHGTSTVTVEHLYLGLLRQRGAGYEVLVSLGVDISKSEARVRAMLSKGTDTVDKSRIELSSAAQACLFNARRSARSARFQFTGTDHLLAGIVDDGGPVAQMLAEMGAMPAAVASRAAALQATQPVDNGSWLPPGTSPVRAQPVDGYASWPPPVPLPPMAFAPPPPPPKHLAELGHWVASAGILIAFLAFWLQEPHYFFVEIALGVIPIGAMNLMIVGGKKMARSPEAFALPLIHLGVICGIIIIALIAWLGWGLKPSGL